MSKVTVPIISVDELRYLLSHILSYDEYLKIYDFSKVGLIDKLYVKLLEIWPDKPIVAISFKMLTLFDSKYAKESQHNVGIYDTLLKKANLFSEFENEPIYTKDTIEISGVTISHETETSSEEDHPIKKYFKRYGTITKFWYKNQLYFVTFLDPFNAKSALGANTCKTNKKEYRMTVKLLDDSRIDMAAIKKFNILTEYTYNYIKSFHSLNFDVNTVFDVVAYQLSILKGYPITRQLPILSDFHFLEKLPNDIIGYIANLIMTPRTLIRFMMTSKKIYDICKFGDNTLCLSSVNVEHIDRLFRIYGNISAINFKKNIGDSDKEVTSIIFKNAISAESAFHALNGKTIPSYPSVGPLLQLSFKNDCYIGKNLLKKFLTRTKATVTDCSKGNVHVCYTLCTTDKKSGNIKDGWALHGCESEWIKGESDNEIWYLKRRSFYDRGDKCGTEYIYNFLTILPKQPTFQYLQTIQSYGGKGMLLTYIEYRSSGHIIYHKEYNIDNICIKHLQYCTPTSNNMYNHITLSNILDPLSGIRNVLTYSKYSSSILESMDSYDIDGLKFGKSIAYEPNDTYGPIPPHKRKYIVSNWKNGLKDGIEERFYSAKLLSSIIKWKDGRKISKEIFCVSGMVSKKVLYFDDEKKMLPFERQKVEICKYDHFLPYYSIDDHRSKFSGVSTTLPRTGCTNCNITSEGKRCGLVKELGTYPFLWDKFSSDIEGEACIVCTTKENIVEGITLKKCGTCKKKLYCSRECQSADWPAHKPICQPIDARPNYFTSFPTP